MANGQFQRVQQALGVGIAVQIFAGDIEDGEEMGVIFDVARRSMVH